MPNSRFSETQSYFDEVNYVKKLYKSVMDWRKDVASGKLKDSYPLLGKVCMHYCSVEGVVSNDTMYKICLRSQHESDQNDGLFVYKAMGEFYPAKM